MPAAEPPNAGFLDDLYGKCEPEPEREPVPIPEPESFDDCPDAPPPGGVVIRWGADGVPRIVPRRNVQQIDFDRADALVAIAQDVVRGTRRDRAPIEVVLTIPASTLTSTDASDHVDPAGVAFFGDGTCVTSTTARRLSCDAGVVELTKDEHGNALSVVATGERGYQTHRRHRYPGTHPVERGRFFAAAVPRRREHELSIALRS